MRLFENPSYPFIKNRRFGYIFSAILIAISLSTITLKGFQYGIDFLGGREIVIQLEVPVPIDNVRRLLSEELNQQVMVRNYGSDRELQIRVTDTADIDSLNTAIVNAFQVNLPDNDISVIKTDLIGPSFANDMRTSAFWATIFSMLVIALYIFIRFKNLSFSSVVLVTLLHDVIIILGLFTLLNGILPFNMDIDQVLIAAFLTIIGYSLNDTIVVFDRIRENLMIYKGNPWEETVNKSINQTLSRTVVTSLTTFLAVFILFVFGGAVLKGFSFAILLGVILGTYSTICISCPLLVDIMKKSPLKNRNKESDSTFRSKNIAA